MTQLQGRDLDAALARALGQDVQPQERFYLNKKTGLVTSIAKFSTDLNAMHEVEKEIERRGLEDVYVSALLRECAVTVPHKRSYATTGFACAHATAEQRARAALAVLLETSQR